MQKIRSRVSEKWLDENDILRIKYLEGASVDTPSVIAGGTDNVKLIGNRKELVLCDARASFTITPEAQKFAIKEINRSARIATAVITNKAYVQVMANFALRFSKIRSSVKVFKNEKEAIAWLQSFKKNQVLLIGVQK